MDMVCVVLTVSFFAVSWGFTLFCERLLEEKR